MGESCDRCNRPDGEPVAELESGAWRDSNGQWHGSQGLEVDLVPRTSSITEATVHLEAVDVAGETRQLCRPCRRFHGVGASVDRTGQALLV